ncbi:DUF2828 family protein [Massilibacterium senegalense]|uniref:DUF2828 family protein n=1 Tax=Massilibacterium senegalense TaxID=1632858 RepID=UPI0012B557A8
MKKVKPKQYRKTLSSLCTKIGIVEQKMSRKEWNTISYPAIPSQVMLKYRQAFL